MIGIIWIILIMVLKVITEITIITEPPFQHIVTLISSTVVAFIVPLDFV